MGSWYQSDSMHHACDVCKGICNRMMLHFSYYCKYGVLAFGDDGTGPADESKRTKCIQGWAHQIMGGRLLLFAIRPGKNAKFPGNPFFELKIFHCLKWQL